MNIVYVLQFYIYEPEIPDLFAPYQLLTFATGAVLGQAALTSHLSARFSDILGWIVDLLVVFLLVGCLQTNRAIHLAMHSYIDQGYSIIALFVFGICRTRCLTGRLLSNISGLGIYSYSVYVCQYPIMNWMDFVLSHKENAQTFLQLSTFDYASLPCSNEFLGSMDTETRQALVPPFTLVSVACTILCVAVAITHVVQLPCQRMVNRYLSAMVVSDEKEIKISQEDDCSDGDSDSATRARSSHSSSVEEDKARLEHLRLLA
jgi:peptidoglycan/LPS O-acetylase OafA/YrhL